jgi:hypothetical protein
MRRDPSLRPENQMAGALDDIERLKELMSRVTDGSGLVVSPSGGSGGGSSTPTTPGGGVEPSPHVLYGTKNTNSLLVTAATGLDVAYQASQVWVDGVFYNIAAGTLTLADDDTNYVFVATDGTVQSNTTGYPAGSLPLATVVTVGGAITNVADRRSYLSDQGLAQAHTLFGTTHTESLRITDGGTDDLAFDDGNTAIGGTDRGEGDANESNATKVTLTGGLYTTISFYGNVSPTGTRHVNIGIYDDSAGAPGTLQATTGYVVIAGSASPSWNTIALTAPATLAAGTYHIAVLGDSGLSVVTHWYYDTGASGDSHEDNPDTVSDGLETTWSGGSSGSKVLSAYISGTNTVPVVDYEAGQIWIGSTFYSIVAGSIDIAPDTLSYVFVDSAGTVTSNTSGFPSDCAPLAEVTAVDENITLIEDRRSYLLQFGASYSDEQAQDAVGLILANTDEITLSYDDGTPQITADINADSVVVGRVHFTDTTLLLGRSTAAAGAGEEISIGDGLDLTAGVLSATGGGGGLTNPVDFLQIDDVDFVLDIVASNPRITFDTDDFIEWNRADDTFTLVVGTASKFSYVGGVTDEFRYNAVARYTEPAVLSGTVVLDTRGAGAGAVARLDLISYDAIAGVDWYRKSATDTRIKFALELVDGVEQDPDLYLFRFTGAGGAETKTAMMQFVNATGGVALLGAGQLFFRSGDQYIYSPSAGVLTLVSTAGGAGTLNLFGSPIVAGAWDGAFFATPGHARIGSTTAPTNTDPGDLTVERLFVGGAEAEPLLESLFTADGDILYRDIDDVIKALPIGGANKVLTVTSGVPSWQDPTGGGGAPAIPVWHRNFMMMGA